MVRDFSHQVQCFGTEKFSPLVFGSAILDPPDADFAELDHTRGEVKEGRDDPQAVLIGRLAQNFGL